MSSHQIPALLKDLADYHASVAAWSDAHPGDRFPAPVLHISLQGAPPEDRLADLHEIATAFGVEVRSEENGTKAVQQKFGAVVVKATYRGTSSDRLDSGPEAVPGNQARALAGG